MPKSVFDIQQYELRNRLPNVYTQGQINLLNQTISDINGQLDWNAQLLGFNGPNYWGTNVSTVDGTYRWVGLPETVSEKRALQSGAFGIYNVNKPYELWPRPFNRGVIGASGDQTFSIREEGGETVISPYGLSKLSSYKHSPYLIKGATYTFDGIVEVEEGGQGVYVTQDTSQGITQVDIYSEGVNSLTVKLEGSDANPFLFLVESWEDISDWRDKRFLGVWGSKGNELSFHFSSDALDIHGFNEEYGLVLDPIRKKFSLSEFLIKAGLKPTVTTPLSPELFKFFVEGCEGFFSPELSLETQINRIETQNYEELVTESGISLTLDDLDCAKPDFITFETDGTESVSGFFDNGSFDTPEQPQGFLDNSEYPFTIPPSDTVSDGGFALFETQEITTESGDILASNLFELDSKPCFALPPSKFGICETGDYKIEFFQNLDETDLFISPDPGPGTSFPMGVNGVSGLQPLNCTVDNNVYEVQGFPEYLVDNGLLESEVLIEEFLINGLYDQDPYTICQSDFDSERIIDYDSLVIDVGGEPGPVLYSDLGETEELTLVGYDPIIGEFELVFDGPRIDSIEIRYEGLTTLGEVFFPIVEWSLENKLDNSTFYPVPEQYPWVTSDDGEYGEERFVNWNYDDGWFGLSPISIIVDQGIYNSESLTYYNTGLIDNGYLILNQTPYLGPNSVDGNGSVILEPECVTYDGGDDFSDFYQGCELDNGSEDEENIPSSSTDEGSYNKGIIPCLPCVGTGDQEVSNTFEYRFNLDKELFRNPDWYMVPSVLNSKSPLRVWKNRVLLSEENLIADENNGTEDPNNLNYFMRLPLEYPRGEKFWGRVEKICSNFGYFSETDGITPGEIFNSKSYPKLYGEDFEDWEVIYDEPYLTSSSLSDEYANSQRGFTNSIVKTESEGDMVYFSSGLITNYEPFQLRKPKTNGEWVGDYYIRNRQGLTSGHLENDVDRGLLRRVNPEERPVWDTSSTIYPDFFPPQLEVGERISNYKVSYAYFTSDFSAADEPVFDPQVPYCHRDRCIKGKTLTGEVFDITTEGDQALMDEEVKPVETCLPTRTAYLIGV